MLPTFVTNLFWGAPDSQEVSGDVENLPMVEHSVQEEGEDWLLIDTAQHSTETPSVQGSSHLNSECDADSVMSDGSWVITPAPTFRHSGDSQECGTFHPLEDLLIEHPTMSVYRHHNTNVLGNINKQIHEEEGTNMNTPEPNQQRNTNNQNHELVLLQNRQRHQLAVQMQIPQSLEPPRAPTHGNKPPRLTRRALKRHNTNNVRYGKHQGSRISKCSFKAGRRRC